MENNLGATCSVIYNALMIQNKIFIVRHGESENNLLEIDCSKLENKDMFGLTEAGKRQIENGAKKYKDFDLIITSPFKRSVETANIFALYSKCKIVEDILLREVDYGDLELCSYEESDAWLKENGNDDSVPFPNGESLLNAKQRAVEFLNKLNQTHSNKRILIVTHGHIVLFLQELLDKNFDMQYALDNYDDNDSRKVIEINCN